MLSLALVVAAIVATPVERTNGVISTLYLEDYESKGDIRFIAVNTGCPGCRGPLPANLYPYHLTNYDGRRGLMKRSPLFPFPFPLAKKKKIPKKGIKKAPLFGKKGLKKAKKVSPFAKKGFKKAKPFGKKAIKKGVPASALGSGGIGIPSIGIPSVGAGGLALFALGQN